MLSLIDNCSGMKNILWPITTDPNNTLNQSERWKPRWVLSQDENIFVLHGLSVFILGSRDESYTAWVEIISPMPSQTQFTQGTFIPGRPRTWKFLSHFIPGWHSSQCLIRRGMKLSQDEFIPRWNRVNRMKGKVCIQARRPIRPALNSSFCSMKQLGILLLPMDRMLVHRMITLPALWSLVPIYTPGWRETTWNKVSCLRKQHGGRDQARATDLQIGNPTC